MIQNPYALDTEGNLVSAVEAVKKQDYYCVTCKGRMRLAGGNGTRIQSHFRHIDTSVEHSGETFLHDYTKHYIANQISKLDVFEIGYWTSEICCNDDCPFGNNNCINEKPPKRYNIKQYYDGIEVEGTYKLKVGGMEKVFRADILFTSKRFEDKPIFIEIAVTHECEPEKKKSGIRIIEIIIPPDLDYNKLSITRLIENKKGHVYENDVRVRFYNFNKNRHEKSKQPFGDKKMKAIIYKEDGSIPIWDIDCDEYGRKICRDSVKEIHFAIEPDNFRYTPAKAIAKINGIPCKDCRFCSSCENNPWSQTTKYVCNETKEEIKGGKVAEKCSNYQNNEMKTLEWASKIDSSSYTILDKSGNRIIPVNVAYELKKIENEMDEYYNAIDPDDLPY